MPRTKKVQVPKLEKGVKLKELLLKKLHEEEKRVMDLLDAQMKKELQELDLRYKHVMTKYPKHMLNRTIGEIKRGEVDSTLNSTKASKTTNQTLSRTRSRRSLSLACDDEGYTTAESTRGTTSGDRTTRQSRSRAKGASAKPISRSLSRNTTKKLVSMRTPLNKQPSNGNIGSITPKVKPNTPQMIVRRPKMGEMAWSTQGSPLLTSHTVSAESVANVNIPLPDGNLVSLLPQHGVRMSQMPTLDQDTRRQLQVLRDNLIKVCSELKF